MTHEEFAKIVLTIRGCYQKETNLFANEQIIKLWYEHLKDLDYVNLQVALSAWIDTNKWSPSIADLREMCLKVCDDIPDDWSEAWEKVMFAVRAYGRDNKDAAMKYFDEVTSITVNRIGWFAICTSENISVERANFSKIFQAAKKKYVESKQIHPGVRKVIEATKENNRKRIEVKQEKPVEVKTEDQIFNYSDRIKKLIEETKEKLKG